MSAKPIDPKDIFLSAETFRCAVETLSAHHWLGKSKSVYLYPIWVNLAFECELYLKCLLAICGVTAEKIHFLHKLFAAIPISTQNAVILEYKVLSVATPRYTSFFKTYPHFKADLPSVLQDASQVFPKIRYAYEGLDPGVKMHPHLEIPCRALRNVILAIHPKWPSRLKASIPATFRNH